MSLAGPSRDDRKQPGYSPAQMPVEPRYPGLLGSIAMVLLGWHLLAGYGIDLLWAATGTERYYLWPLVHLATSLFFGYACYVMQPAKGVVKYFAIQRIPWQAATRVPICYVGILVFIIAALLLIYQMLALFGISDDDLSGPPDRSGRPMLRRLIFSIVVAPLGEELVIRGLVLQGLLQRFSAMPAVLMSSLIFGIFHGNAHQAISATVSGCFYGWFFVQTRSLWVTILMHASHNGLLALLGMLGAAYPSNSTEPSAFPIVPWSHPGWFWELLLCGMVLLLIAGAGWWLMVSCYRALQRELKQSTSAMALVPADAPQPSAPLAEFKARRAAPPSESS